MSFYARRKQVFLEQNFQLIEFLSCFLTSMSTVRDGSL